MCEHGYDEDQVMKDGTPLCAICRRRSKGEKRVTKSFTDRNGYRRSQRAGTLGLGYYHDNEED